MESEDEGSIEEYKDVVLTETAVIRLEELKESLGFFDLGSCSGGSAFDFDLCDFGVMDLFEDGFLGHVCERIEMGTSIRGLVEEEDEENKGDSFGDGETHK
jgi:hypothetical protein